LTAKIMPLTSLLPGTTARVVDVQGGLGFQRRLCMMGITHGKKLRMISMQPLHGPITVEISGRQVTLGRGMANKVLVEVVE